MVATMAAPFWYPSSRPRPTASTSRAASGSLSCAATARPVSATSATPATGANGGRQQHQRQRTACGQRQREGQHHPARHAWPLEGGKHRQREPGQHLLEIRQRMQRTGIEITEPRIHEVGVGEAGREREEKSKRAGLTGAPDKACHSMIPMAPSRK